MPTMVMNRDYRYSSTNGYAYVFKKDSPIYVAPRAVTDLLAVGAQLVNATAEEVLSPPKADPSTFVEPGDDERTQLIKMAIHDLIVENKTEKFGANGQPKVDVLEKMVGFDVTAEERTAAFKAVMAAVKAQ